jgi:hypothetical protein
VFFAIDAPAAGPGALAAAAAGSGAGLLAAESHNGVARLEPGTGVRAGERVTFGVDPGRLYFFDAATGTAIR